ncbi:MAG: tetratricopeptide repeat protein [Thermomicrobiales bacterium]
MTDGTVRNESDPHPQDAPDQRRSSDSGAPPRVFSAREAADRLGLNERTIRRAIARGDLAANKRGRAFTIGADELARFRGQRGGGVSAILSRQEEAPPANVIALPLERAAAAVERRSASVLPVPLTRIIGREHEVATIENLFRRDHARLVTLTGPGGVGKTRLALHLAATIRATPGFTGDVVFVSLAEISNPSLVLPAIARAVGIHESPSQHTVDTLGATVGDRRLFLMLDNFEHLIGGGAEEELADLMQRSGGLTLLVTSRTPLRVRGEHLVRIAPLALPEPNLALDGDNLESYGAIALFVERARAVNHRFALDTENASAITAICRRLDGLPLAIELAAAWVRLLSPAALLRQLAPQLPLLTGGASDQPARLQTMHDAIAWSYDLLTNGEQRLFRCLAVFVGGCSLAAAERVWRLGATARGGDDSASFLRALAGLVDKSLLQPSDGATTEPRFLMLETIREFGLEQLTEQGEAPAVQATHAAHFLDLAETAAGSPAGAGGGEWLPRLAPEHANLLAALDWFDTSGQREETLRLASALWHYWYRHGDLIEGQERLEQALSAVPPRLAPAARARALRGAGVLAWQSGQFDLSRRRLEEALANYNALGDRAGAAWTLNSLGCLYATMADEAQAEVTFDEALAIFRALDDAVGVAQMTANLGELAAVGGRHEIAVERLAAALSMWRARGDRVGAARAQVFLGRAFLARGEAAQAETALLDALAAIRDMGYDQILPAALRAVAELAAWRGAAGDAARWLGAEEALRGALAMDLTGTRRARYERVVSTVREDLGEVAFAAEWATGQGLSSAQVITAVLTADSFEPGAAPPSGLTPREREVLRLLAAGHSDRDIAMALFITRRTASKHVSSILTKLGVPSRAAAAALATRDGLI